MARLITHFVDSLFSHARGRVITALAAPTLAIYTVMLVWTIPRLEEYSHGLTILDMQPWGYTPEYVCALFESLGAAGRHFYLMRQIPLDLLFPALYAVTGALLLARLIDHHTGPTLKRRGLVLIPLCAGLCDYLENLGIITMLLRYPDLSHASLTNLFSLAKSLLTTLFCVLIVVESAAVLVVKLRRRLAA